MEYKEIFADLELFDCEKNLLSNSDMAKFHSFLELLQKNKCRLIFRGESKINELYNCDVGNITELLERIFMVGPKGKHFWKQESKYIYKTLCKETFKQLFDEFHNLFTRNDIRSEKLKNHLNSFKDSDKKFYTYFANNDNFVYFWKNISNHSQKERNIILDYYLSILHSAGQIAIKGSYMLSTSLEIKEAMRYQNNGIIYVSWIGKSNNNGSYYDLNKVNNFIKNNNLPYYTQSIYPEDNEICVKYGILPHRIIGIIIDKYFFVNHNFFNQQQDLSNVLKSGFDIDQTHFDEIIKLTNYKHAYNVHECANSTCYLLRP